MRRLLSWLAVVAILSGLGWLALNVQYATDLYRAWRYEPGSSELSLRSRLQLTDEGRLYFDASHSHIQDARAFNSSCGQSREANSPILGCYAAQRVFIYNVTNEKLRGIEETTAAHEILHAAYERLSDDEKKEVDAAIKQILPDIMNKELEERLAYYRRTEPGQEFNELHSILGSEFSNVGEKLETHYARYFANRKKIVSYYKQYSSMFTSVKERLERQAKTINTRTDALNVSIENYNSEMSNLAADIQAFNQRADEGDFTSQAAFTAEREKLASKQSELRQREQELRKELSVIKELVKKRDALVSEYDELNKSINSTIKQPLVPVGSSDAV